VHIFKNNFIVNIRRNLLQLIRKNAKIFRDNDIGHKIVRIIVYVIIYPPTIALILKDRKYYLER